MIKSQEFVQVSNQQSDDQAIASAVASAAAAAWTPTVDDAALELAAVDGAKGPHKENKKGMDDVPKRVLIKKGYGKRQILEESERSQRKYLHQARTHQKHE